LRKAAHYLARATRSSCNEIPLGANALGLARVGAIPGDTALDARAMLAKPRKAYVLYGCEPPLDFADGGAALTALGQAGHVVAFTAFASEALKRVATVILPIGLLPEIDATLVNVDGAVQTVTAAAKPPGEARPGWKVLRAIGSALSIEGFGFTEIGEVRAQIGAIRVEADSSISPILPELPEQGIAAEAAPTPQASAGRLTRIATTAIYGGDAVLRRSPALQAHPLSQRAGAVLHPEDALALGVGHGASARVSGMVLPVELSTRVPRGCAWIEAGHAATATLPPYGAILDIAKA
jgi:NADH-quinone oxidoreductase subunit G